jgi:hypothetical protein
MQILMSVVVPALPIVQAVVLMGIYIFLGPIVILSRYSLQSMALGGIAIFTVKFWSVMWTIVRWLDDNLVQSMYPDLSKVMEFLASAGGDTLKRIVLDMIILSLYIGLPMLWSVMMTMVGIKVGTGIYDAKMATLRPAQHAGAAGGAAAAKVIGGAGKKIVR